MERRCRCRGGTWSYGHNGLGRRTFKRAPGNVLTRYLHGADGHLLAETSPGGTTLTSIYLWLNGQPIGLVRGGQVYLVHADHLGRPEILTNSSKAIVWRAENLAFDRKVVTSSLGDYNLGFPGQYYDAEGASWQNWHRTYDGSVGRYTQGDPLGLYDGPNTYTYVYNNPINYTDPTGEFGPAGALIGGGVDLALQLSANGWDLNCVNPWQVAAAAALGAATGGLGSAAGRQGLTAGVKGLSNQTKGAIGEALSTAKHTLLGSSRVATQQRIPGQRSVADSVWQGRNGSTYYVESKFGTSGLTNAQKAAQRALGGAYQVDRWGYPLVGSTGGALGGTAGATAGGVATHAAGNSGCGCN